MQNQSKETVQGDIKETIYKISFLRDRIEAIKNEQLRVQKMIVYSKENNESSEIITNLMGQYYQLKMDENRFSSDLDNTNDILDDLGKKLQKLKKDTN